MAQSFPNENDTLNYRLIGFRFQEAKKAESYTIEIADGYVNDETSFKKNIVLKITSSENRKIILVPSFGKQYTWRVTPVSASVRSSHAKMHHFYTGIFPDADTTSIKLNITQSAEKFNDAYLIMDGNRTMYDMEGNPVWYLPDIKGMIRTNSQVRDIKLSPVGTITFLVDGRAFETDYGGKILWEGPNGRKKIGDSLEGYHHELTRLSNGHIMVLGSDPMVLPTALSDSLVRRKVADSTDRRPRRPQKHNFGTIIEYDESGKQVWEWRASNYFKNINLDYYKKSNGMSEYDIHENSFFFDEKNKLIYISFRNLGQVLKIKYPSGEVATAYGKLEYPTDSMENHIFCSQHSCHISEKGYLYLFDNGCGIGHIPKVVVMKMPATEMDTLKKIWEFPLPVEPQPVDNTPVINSVALNRRYMFTAGGNVLELGDNSFFVSANVPYNKLFIVTPDKHIVWSAEMIKWHADKKSWEPFSQYRASIIPTRALLENLIWKSTEQ